MHRLRALVFRLTEASGALGLGRALLVGPRWLVRREFLVLTRDLRLPLPGLRRDNPMRWTVLTVREIPCVVAMNPLLTDKEIRRRWAEGQECSLGWLDGTLVYYRWQGVGAVHLPYLGKTLRLARGDCFVSEVFTHPGFRRQGVFWSGVLWHLHRTRERGFTRTVSTPAWWNAQSIRAQQKAGFAIAGRVGYWNLGVWRKYFADGYACLEETGEISILRSAEVRNAAAVSTEDWHD